MGSNEPSSVRADGAIPESDVFHILGNDRRRELIANIANRPDGVVVSELAEEIARLEGDGADPTRDLYKSVYVSLQQTHLPKLAEEGVVRYDPETNRVEPGPRLGEVTVYVTDDEEESWGHQLWPLVVSLVGLAVLLGAVSGVPLVSSVSAPVWAIVFLSVIAVIGAYAWLQ